MELETLLSCLLFTKLSTNVFVRIVLPKIQVSISEAHYWEDYSLDDGHDVRFQELIRKRMTHTRIKKHFDIGKCWAFQRQLTQF